MIERSIVPWLETEKAAGHEEKENERLKPSSNRVVVFVHGILSSHSPFQSLRTYLAGRLEGWDFAYYDYNYHQPLANNGRSFAQALQRAFQDVERPTEVVLITHSMGGLVARLAILSSAMPFLSKVFLLGTPNFGAIRTAQLGLGTQLIRRASGVVFGLLLRKPGIHDLTRVYEIFRSFGGCEANASRIDYISIPGCYFHEDREKLHRTRGDVWSEVFATVDVSFSMVPRALGPLFTINMERPHDGIVEERSNSLIPCKPGRWSEKAATLNSPIGPRTYVHAVPKASEELTHTDIHSNSEVMKIIGDIMQAPSVAAWRAALTEVDYSSLQVTP